MKYSTGIVTTITLIGALVLSGCDRNSNRTQTQDAQTSVIEAERDLDIAQTEVEADLKKYRLEQEEQMVEHNRTISDIKQQINNESDAEEKVRLERDLAEHEAKQRELKRELDNYRVSGRDNWDNFKDDFSSRMDDLGNSLDNFFSNTRTTTSRNQ